MTAGDAFGHDSPTRERRSARVILIGPGDQLLLFRVGVGFETAPSGILTMDGFWALPGGGLDPGEDYDSAAVRELYEETGHRVGGGLACVATRTSSYPWKGERWVSHEQIYFARAGHTGLDRSRWTESDRRWIHSCRWWTVPELAAVREPVRPAGLGGLVARLLAGDVPSTPVAL